MFLVSSGSSELMGWGWLVKKEGTYTSTFLSPLKKNMMELWYLLTECNPNSSSICVVSYILLLRTPLCYSVKGKLKIFYYLLTECIPNSSSYIPSVSLLLSISFFSLWLSLSLKSSNDPQHPEHSSELTKRRKGTVSYLRSLLRTRDSSSNRFRAIWAENKAHPIMILSTLVENQSKLTLSRDGSDGYENTTICN